MPFSAMFDGTKTNEENEENEEKKDADAMHALYTQVFSR